MYGSETDAQPRLDPRYLVVFGACATQFIVIGLLFAYGVLFKVFETEFGWSRTFLSSCGSLAFLMMGILAMVAGRLSDRYGPRIVLSCSGLLYGIGFLLMSLVAEPWQLFAIFGVFIGIGLSTHDVVTLSTVARWFERRRGIMTGVVKVGTALGQIVLPPLVAFAVLGIGWRPAVVVIGILCIVLLLAVARLTKAPPEPANPGAQSGRKGIAFAEARRSRIFWTICAIQLLFFPALMTVPLHIVVHGTDLGMTAPMAATLLSVIGGSSIVGRLTIGTFADRIRGRRAYILCLVPLICSLLALMVTGTPWLLFTVIALYGFGHGGLFTVVSPTVAEYFGLRAHGAIFGVVLFCGTIGGAIGPIIAGRVFDVAGSYFWAFAGLAAMAATGLALVLTLPPSPESRST